MSTADPRRSALAVEEAVEEAKRCVDVVARVGVHDIDRPEKLRAAYSAIDRLVKIARWDGLEIACYIEDVRCSNALNSYRESEGAKALPPKAESA